MSNASITERVRAAFKGSGMSREEMAQRCGVSRVAVGYWLNGDRIPNRDSLERFAKVCGVTVAYFYESARALRDVAITKRLRPVRGAGAAS